MTVALAVFYVLYLAGVMSFTTAVMTGHADWVFPRAVADITRALFQVVTGIGRALAVIAVGVLRAFEEHPLPSRMGSPHLPPPPPPPRPPRPPSGTEKLKHAEAAALARARDAYYDGDLTSLDFADEVWAVLLHYDALLEAERARQRQARLAKLTESEREFERQVAAANPEPPRRGGPVFYCARCLAVVVDPNGYCPACTRKRGEQQDRRLADGTVIHKVQRSRERRPRRLERHWQNHRELPDGRIDLGWTWAEYKRWTEQGISPPEREGSM